MVAEADGRLLGFISLAEGGYIDLAYFRAEARQANGYRRADTFAISLARHASMMPLRTA